MLGMTICVVAVLVSLYSWIHRRQSLDRISLALDAQGHLVDEKAAPKFLDYVRGSHGPAIAAPKLFGYS